jgi:phosphate:Na+ symporter
MNGIIQALDLIGGLGILLIGMRWMSDGIQRRAGNKFRRVLHTMTNNRFAGVATGLGVTSVIQSSSATTVLLVSLVNAGLISLRQSIGVIMGANIGTTLTAWIVSLVGFKMKITNFALPAIAIALPMHFAKSQRLKEIADILIGFGLLFLGLHLMKESVPDISANPDVLAFLQGWSDLGYLSVITFIIVGSLLTVVVQSSSAAMTITITMAFRGWISFPIAAAIVLGENIGTTVTAFLASLPMAATAKRAARAHMIFNIIGVIWMLAVFYPMTRLVDAIIAGPASDPENIPLHLSMFHTLFNVMNTTLLLPFVGMLAKLVERMVPERIVVSATGGYQLSLVAPNIPDALDSNLITIRSELAEMSAKAGTMLSSVMDVSRHPEELSDVREELAVSEQLLDDMQEEITRFLTESMRQSVSEAQAQTIQASQRIAHELESVSDSCFSIGMLFDRLQRKGWHLHDAADDELYAYSRQVLEFIEYNRVALEDANKSIDVAHSLELEKQIDKVRNKLKKRSRRAIERDKEPDVKGELAFIDIVRHLEHIGDYTLNVSQALAELT